MIDVYTRFIVDWGISNSMTAQWCAGITKEAIERYGKPQIINSDQGSQFTSEAHTVLLKNQDINISMDGKGRAIDNIFIERFWRSIKYEDIYLKAYGNGLALYQGVSKYMHFYNNKRLHQHLNYQTPAAVYKQATAA